jgi:hypothetical protein
VPIVVVMHASGALVTGLPDPSGGVFDAAGDFDRLIPPDNHAFPLLSQVDPYGRMELPSVTMSELIAEVDALVPIAREGSEQRGLLRLRALASACACEAASCLIFTGD